MSDSRDKHYMFYGDKHFNISMLPFAIKVGLLCFGYGIFSRKYLILFSRQYFALFVSWIYFLIRSLFDNICLPSLHNLNDFPKKIKKYWSVHRAAINTKYKDYISYQSEIIIPIIKTLLPTAVLHTCNFWITSVLTM